MTDHPGYRVQLLGPREVDVFLSKFSRTPENMNARRTLVLAGGLEIKGSFEITARDVRSGEIEWEHAGENLVTDYGRRFWMQQRFNTMPLGFAPSRETPHVARAALCTDASQCFSSGNLTPVNTISTHTKTLTTTFGTPAANRTLGTICLLPAGAGAAANLGQSIIAAYALLTPAKTQTTTQTLEVVYKISMTPIV